MNPVLTVTQDQVWGYVRAGIAAIGGYFVAKGKLSNDDLTVILGVAGTIFTAIWSHVSNRK